MKRILNKIRCFFGKHKMRIGFGWSNGKRYDTCYYCNHSRWVEDDEGYTEIIKYTSVI